MEHIDEFIARYIREFDFYETTARLVANTLEQDLQEAGVRCIVTHRAKSAARLSDKCQQRNSENAYSSVEQIYKDIVDLAGVRIALYFPGQRDLVGSRIANLFHVSKVKLFPAESPRKTKKKRFEGYCAAHYRIRLREETLSDSDKRYASAQVEIQVASVLMHGWAEVEHDLVYKPQTDSLSEEEYAILDQLNGLVATGEEMLESLQRASDRRIADSTRKFPSHYELATHIISHPRISTEKPISESGLGRVDLLFDFLAELGLGTPKYIDRYLEGLDGNLEVRPLAQQVIDALMAEDPSRYGVYQNVRKRRFALHDEPASFDALVGRFLTSWISLEQLERDLVPPVVTGRRISPTGRLLSTAGYIDEDTARRVDYLRRLRNELVHGVEQPSSAVLDEAADQIDAIVAAINSEFP